VDGQTPDSALTRAFTGRFQAGRPAGTRPAVAALAPARLRLAADRRGGWTSSSSPASSVTPIQRSRSASTRTCSSGQTTPPRRGRRWRPAIRRQLASARG